MKATVRGAYTHTHAQNTLRLYTALSLSLAVSLPLTETA